MSKPALIPAGILALVLLLAGCGGADEGTAASSDNGMSLSIGSPDDGAEVTLPFTVDLDSSVPLDDPETGEHHVHVFFDGDDGEYILVYADSIEIDELPDGVTDGKHVMNASLRNADHSAAGVETEIELTVATGEDGGADEDGAGDVPDDGY